MTFPAFMSVSTDDSVADDFGDFVFFVFVKVRGATNRSAQPACPRKRRSSFLPRPFSVSRRWPKLEPRKSFVGGQEVKTGGTADRYFGARTLPFDVFEPHGVAIFRYKGRRYGCFCRCRSAAATCRCFRRLRRRFAGARRGPQNHGVVLKALEALDVGLAPRCV